MFAAMVSLHLPNLGTKSRHPSCTLTSFYLVELINEACGFHRSVNESWCGSPLRDHNYICRHYSDCLLYHRQGKDNKSLHKLLLSDFTEG